MDALKSFLEALKATTYGVLALLIPGAALVEILRRVAPLHDLVTQGGAVSYLAVAYFAGAAVQGVASFLFARKPLCLLVNEKTLREAEEHAQRIIEARLGEKISGERVFDLCLSRMEKRRDSHDKFVALRDMSRALALASILAAIMIAARHWHELLSVPYGSAFLGSLLAAAAFLERYQRFAPLGRQIVYAQFIAAEMK